MRKLTDKQLFALDCVSKARVVARRDGWPNRFGPTWRFFAVDAMITDQIRSLRARRLIRVSFYRVVPDPKNPGYSKVEQREVPLLQIEPAGQKALEARQPCAS